MDRVISSMSDGQRSWHPIFMILLFWPYSAKLLGGIAMDGLGLIYELELLTLTPNQQVKILL
jgi:hypothetical protein